MRARAWLRTRLLSCWLLAGFASTAFAQDLPAPLPDPAADLPRIAVYVTGSVPDNEKSALGARMLTSLINSGRYGGFDRSTSLLTAIESARQTQGGAALDDRQICTIGKEFGTNFVCIAAITPVLGDFQVTARIVSTETAQIAFIGESYSHLKSVVDLVRVADNVVKSMFGEQTEPWSESRPEATPAPNPSSTTYTHESAQPTQSAQGYDALQQQGQAALQQGAAALGQAALKQGAGALGQAALQQGAGALGDAALQQGVGALGQAALKQGAGALGQAALQQGGATLGQAALHEALKNKSRANGIVIRALNVGGSGTRPVVEHGLAYIRHVSPKTSLISETNYLWGGAGKHGDIFTGRKAALLLQHRFGDPGKTAFFVEGSYEVDWLYLDLDGSYSTRSVFNQGGSVGIGVVFYAGEKNYPIYLDLPRIGFGSEYLSYMIAGLRVAIPF